MAKINKSQKVEIRIGLIEKVEDFYSGGKHYYFLLINFGKTIGFKKSVVEIDYYYQKGDLIGKKIAAVTNITPFQIGPWTLEAKALTLLGSLEKQLLVIPEKQGVEIGKAVNIW